MAEHLRHKEPEFIFQLAPQAHRGERADGSTATFKATVRVDTPTEGRYYENGGILPYVLRSLL